MSFAEKGAVADIDPAFYVGYLHRVKATGTLKFEDASIQRAIYLRDGRVLFSSSNAPEDQLGAILVAAGKIEQDQFDLIVATLQPKQSIAAALAQGGHVSQRDIGDAARRKVEQIVGSPTPVCKAIPSDGANAVAADKDHLFTAAGHQLPHRGA